MSMCLKRARKKGRLAGMEIIGVHLPEGGALDEPVRALFELQSQALKAAQEQADAFQLRIDALEQQPPEKLPVPVKSEEYTPI